jgi:hypothetical protein
MQSCQEVGQSELGPSIIGLYDLVGTDRALFCGPLQNLGTQAIVIDLHVNIGRGSSVYVPLK